MRGHLILKLIGLVVFMILTVMSARAFSASSPKSPLNSVNVENNAKAGYCANQQVTNEASGGSGSSATTQNPLSYLSPQAQTEANNLGLNFNCPTTTTDNFGG
jgi:cellulase/cellobiase CelA1